MCQFQRAQLSSNRLLFELAGGRLNRCQNIIVTRRQGKKGRNFTHQSQQINYFKTFSVFHTNVPCRSFAFTMSFRKMCERNNCDTQSRKYHDDYTTCCRSTVGSLKLYTLLVINLHFPMNQYTGCSLSSSLQVFLYNGNSRENTQKIIVNKTKSQRNDQKLLGHHDVKL